MTNSVEKTGVDGILVHYGEIALKGNNREFFEEKLIENLKRSLRDLGYSRVTRLPGRIYVEHDPGTDVGLEQYGERIAKVFGVVNYSYATTSPRNLDSMKKASWEVVSGKDFRTFRVRTRRADKGYRLTSPEINEKIGSFLQKKYEEAGNPKEVDLDDPELTLFIELVGDRVFYYPKKVKGPGGLPVSTAGTLVGLISAGIDSPVAAWQTMKRGAKVLLCHFHSYPRTAQSSQYNVRDIAGVLSSWQGKTRLYMVNIREIQRRIITRAPKRLRIVFYRRAMLKAASLIAGKEGAGGLVTGDSLAQVSSQTLENLRAAGEAIPSDIPLYRPNIGLDKAEIQELARKIGTYKISTRASSDCCVYIRPEFPETRASLERVRKIDEGLEIDELIETAVEEAPVESFEKLA